MEEAGNHLMNKPHKRWNDTIKECLRKKEVEMAGKQGEWSRIRVNGKGCKRECMGCSPGDETPTLMKY